VAANIVISGRNRLAYQKLFGEEGRRKRGEGSGNKKMLKHPFYIFFIQKDSFT